MPMVYVPRTRRDGTDCSFKIEPMLAATNERIYNRVKKKGFDYVCIVAGLPGVGKSKFAQLQAKYMCPWFDEKYIAWNAERFIQITSNCPNYSAVILDESFNSLNSKIMYNPDFLRIINHLQIIRQKYLFIFLCLPNFFDLSKGIAGFRASNLFVVYSDENDDKGYYMCFGRNETKQLYILGSKFMDYNARRANFHGKFPNHSIIPDEIYEGLKRKYTLDVDNRLRLKSTEKSHERFLKAVIFINKEIKIPLERIAKATNLSLSTLKNMLVEYNKEKKRID